MTKTQLKGKHCYELKADTEATWEEIGGAVGYKGRNIGHSAVVAAKEWSEYRKLVWPIVKRVKDKPEPQEVGDVEGLTGEFEAGTISPETVIHTLAEQDIIPVSFD